MRIYDQVARSSNSEPQTSTRSTNYDQHEKPTRVSLICVNYSMLIGSIGRNIYIYIILSYEALVTQHNYLDLISLSQKVCIYMQFLPHFKWGIPQNSSPYGDLQIVSAV